MDHSTMIGEWRRSAQAHDDENYEFLRSLKFRDYGYDPDNLAADMHERVFKIIDCTRCANCCKTVDIMLTPTDAERIAGHLAMAIDEFVEAYLTTDEGDQYWVQEKPCPFLSQDDCCTIYDVRPKNCREYPHTDKEEFATRTIQHANNALTCPAVFWIVENMKRSCSYSS